jgi:hypothetical protein
MILRLRRKTPAGQSGFWLALVFGMVLQGLSLNAIAAPASGDGEWIPLFGKGWDADWYESRFYQNAGYRGKKVFSEANGLVTTLTDKHSRAHLYYVGPVQNAKFHNFEVKIEVKLDEKANGGLYFRANVQEFGWPKEAFEIKFNNDHFQTDKTGSLHKTVPVRQSPVDDNQWFELHLIVNGNHVVSKINGETMVDWQIPAGDKHTGIGTFALQKHTLGIQFRNMRVKVLPD